MYLLYFISRVLTDQNQWNYPDLIMECGETESSEEMKEIGWRKVGNVWEKESYTYIKIVRKFFLSYWIRNTTSSQIVIIFHKVETTINKKNYAKVKIKYSYNAIQKCDILPLNTNIGQADFDLSIICRVFNRI